MSKNNKNKKKKVKALAPRPNLFVYTSVCCEAPAKKPALVRTEEAEGHLGHWRCTKCAKSCKVKRSRVKEKDNGKGDSSPA